MRKINFGNKYQKPSGILKSVCRYKQIQTQN